MNLAVIGTVESLIYGCLSGWARHTNSDERVSLVISVNGLVAAETVANLPHKRHLRDGSGDGNYGFFVPLPLSAFAPGDENIITVRPKLHNGGLKGSPFTTDATAVSGRFNSIKDGYARGWVAPQLPVFRSINVELIADGTVIANTLPTIVRQDMKAYGLAEQATGLRIKLPSSIADGENHLIELRIAGQPLPGSPRTFKAKQTNTSTTFQENETCAPYPTLIAQSTLTSNSDCARKTPDYGKSTAPRGNSTKPHQNELSDSGLEATLILLEKFPKRLKLYVNAAENLHAVGRDDDALSFLDKALLINPHYRKAYSLKIQLLDNFPDKSALINHLSDVHSKFPDNVAWRAKYIASRRERGAEIWALHEYTQLAEEFPDEPALAIQAGLTARALGLRETALDWFFKATKIDSGDAADIHCAIELISLGRLEEAKRVLPAITGDGNDGAQSSWARVLLAAHTDLESAKQQFFQLLKSEQDNERRVRLLKKGQRYAFHDAIEHFLQQHELEDGSHLSNLSWDLYAHRLRNLLAWGRRRTTYKLLQTYPKQASLSPSQLIEYAELWLATGQPTQARKCFSQGVNALRNTELPPSINLESIINVCDEFGEHRLRDELFQQTRHSGDNPHLNVFKQALRLNQEGRTAEAESLIQEQEQSNRDLPSHRWRATLAATNGQHQYAIETLTKPVHEPVVSLEDATLWFRALIDAEEIDKAELELGRLQKYFPDSEIIPLRAEIHNLNMQFEEAVDCLQHAAKTFPLNQKLARALAESLLGIGEYAKAGAIINHGRKMHPANIKWGLLQLSLSTSASKDWGTWRQSYRMLQQQVEYNQRLPLALTHILMRMHMRQHDNAERLLNRVERTLNNYPLPVYRKIRYLINCSKLRTRLLQPEKAASLLAQVQEENVPANLKDLFYRVASANATFGTRDAHRFVELRNQLIATRHHVTLTDFQPDSVVSMIPPSPLRVAVLLHLYHQDIWPELRTYMHSLIGTNFCLFVTIPAVGVNASIIDELRAIDDHVRLIEVENRGFDVGAHWQSLDQINLEEFDLALLLQTKKTTQFKFGPIWRDNLIRSLIGTPSRWRDNLNAFHASPMVGMIGSGLHCRSTDPWNYFEKRQILEALGMPTRFDALKQHSHFVAGTMFLIRANILNEMHKKTRKHLSFENIEDLSIAKRIDRSLAHAMERAFGMYVTWKGYEILWRP